MRVSSDEYRVFSIKKALVAYFIVVSSLVVLFLGATIIFPSIDRIGFMGYSLLLTFNFVLAIWGCIYGYRVIKSRQSPPPGSWVVENWKVYKGLKAYWIGLFIICCGLFMGFFTVEGGYLLWK